VSPLYWFLGFCLWVIIVGYADAGSRAIPNPLPPEPEPIPPRFVPCDCDSRCRCFCDDQWHGSWV
jgi:hypothetical protein